MRLSGYKRYTMKKIQHLFIAAIAIFSLQACHVTHTAMSKKDHTEPVGPVSPATGDASSVSSGKNTTGTPLPNGQTKPDTKKKKDQKEDQ